MQERKKSAPYYVRLTVQECAGIVWLCQKNQIKLSGISHGIRVLLQNLLRAKALSHIEASVEASVAFLEESGVPFARSESQKRGIYRQLIGEVADVEISEHVADISPSKKSRYLELMLLPMRNKEEQAEFESLAAEGYGQD